LSVKITQTALSGVLILAPDVFADDRGFFIETYQLTRYAAVPGLDVEFVQDNHSHSLRHVLRGLHLQRRKPQGKLLRVVTGSIWDVAVDVDPRSPTFRRWVGVELSGANHLQFYVPPGYAHGFCVLSDAADVEYKCTALYDAKDEAGIAWNDRELAIDWPVATPRLSDRDRQNPSLADYLRA
jgi:dTDP-4-dehydrorhamnose 3,5-epimerase